MLPAEWLLQPYIPTPPSSSLLSPTLKPQRGQESLPSLDSWDYEPMTCYHLNREEWVSGAISCQITTGPLNFFSLDCMCAVHEIRGVKYSPWSGDPNAQEQHLALAHTPLFVTALDSRLKIITMCCSGSPEHWAFVWVVEAECSINNL